MNCLDSAPSSPDKGSPDKGSSDKGSPDKSYYQTALKPLTEAITPDVWKHPVRLLAALVRECEGSSINALQSVNGSVMRLESFTNTDTWKRTRDQQFQEGKTKRITSFKFAMTDIAKTRVNLTFIEEALKFQQVSWKELCQLSDDTMNKSDSSSFQIDASVKELELNGHISQLEGIKERLNAQAYLVSTFLSKLDLLRC